MNKYPKIPTIYRRDPNNNYKTLLSEHSTAELFYLRDNLWEYTEKIDGTNIRVLYTLDKLKFGGRTDQAQIQVTLYNKLQEMFQLGKFQSLYPDTPMCLYGEGYGAKIQKGGGDYLDGVSFIVFDVNIGGVWLERKNVLDIARKLEVQVVPIIGGGTLAQAADTVKAGEKSRITDKRNIEGIVMRPLAELQDRQGNRIIAKIKVKDYEST